MPCSSSSVLAYINLYVDVIAVPVSKIKVLGDEINAVGSLFFGHLGLLLLLLLALFGGVVFFLLAFFHLNLLLFGSFAGFLHLQKKKLDMKFDVLPDVMHSV